MRSIVIVAFLACFVLVDGVARGENADDRHRARVIALPFSNGGGASQDYLSLGLAEILTDRLEGSDVFELVVGEIPTLPDDVIHLATFPKDTSGDAHAVAKAHAAEIAIRGGFSGPVWKWRLEVEVLAVEAEGFTTLATATVIGDQTVVVKGRRGETLHVVSLERIQAMLAEALLAAFDKTTLSVPADRFASVGKPICNDSYAFIRHQRAVGRSRNLPWIGWKETALERAEHAVRVEPRCVPARRFYADALDQAGKPKKARGQFEALLKEAPGDIRSIVALGKIELALGELESAKEWLIVATSRRPDDPILHALFGEVLRRSEERPSAIVEYAKAVELLPGDATYRSVLAELYGLEGRHDEAVAELKAVMAIRPDEMSSAFRLGAELRNAGHPDLARAWYATASRTFADARFSKFAEAVAEGMPIDALVVETVARMRVAEALRKDAQMAANDVVMEFGLRGHSACVGSAHKIAESRIASHATAVAAFLGHTSELRARKRQGDWVALGYLEETEAESALVAIDVFTKDREALRTQWVRSIAPVLAKASCDDADAMVDPNSIVRRNESRIVEPVPYRARPSSSHISPDIPDGAVRIVRYRIINGEGTHHLVLTVDGVTRGDVPAGGERTFAEKSGDHVLCLLPDEEECGAPGTLHHVFLFEEWAILVRSAP